MLHTATKHIEKYRNSFIEGIKKFLMEEYEPGEIKVGPPLVEREMMVPEYDLDTILLDANTKTVRLKDEKERLRDEKDRLRDEKDRLRDEKDRLKDRLMEIMMSGKGNIEEVRVKIAEIDSKIKKTERRIKEVESKIKEVENEIGRTERAIREMWMWLMRERRALVVEYMVVNDHLKEIIKDRGLPWPEL